MADWNNRTEVKKGTFGETIVKNYLKNKGFTVYIPELGQHVFDMLAIKEKKEIFIVEVKAQARRNRYPDTGITKKHYDEYNYVADKYNIPFFIFFVDEMLREIYGNWLKELKKPIIVNSISYPLIQEGSTGVRIYFPLEVMTRNIIVLNDDDIVELKKLSTRNYPYNPLDLPIGLGDIS